MENKKSGKQHAYTATKTGATQKVKISGRSDQKNKYWPVWKMLRVRRVDSRSKINSCSLCSILCGLS